MVLRAPASVSRGVYAPRDMGWYDLKNIIGGVKSGAEFYRYVSKIIAWVHKHTVWRQVESFESIELSIA